MPDATAPATPAPVENEPTQGGNTPGERTPSAGGEFTPITSQDELNRIIGERVRRAKPADYDDLKAKAARLDEIETANKTEVEKANDRATKAEAEVAALPAKVAESLREHLVDLGVVSKDDEVLLTASDPETLIAQVKRLAARNEDAAKPRKPAPDPNQGRSGSGPGTTADQFAAAIGAALDR